MPTISRVSTESTVATVYWEVLQGFNGLTKYDILVSSDGHQFKSTPYDWNRNGGFNVSNLSPETVYVFQVRIVTSDENGPWSEPRVGITLPISRFLCYMRHL